MTEVLEGEIIDPTEDGEKVVDAETLKRFNPARMAAKYVATSSVRFAVSGAITALVPVENKRDKRKVFVASMVLSGMVNEKVKPYVDEEIDDAIQFCRTVIAYAKKMEQMRQEAEATESGETDVPNP